MSLGKIDGQVGIGFHYNTWIILVHLPYLSYARFNLRTQETVFRFLVRIVADADDNLIEYLLGALHYVCVTDSEGIECAGEKCCLHILIKE